MSLVECRDDTEITKRGEEAARTPTGAGVSHADDERRKKRRSWMKWASVFLLVL